MDFITVRSLAVQPAISQLPRHEATDDRHEVSWCNQERIRLMCRQAYKGRVTVDVFGVIPLRYKTGGLKKCDCFSSREWRSIVPLVTMDETLWNRGGLPAVSPDPILKPLFTSDS